MYQKDPITLLAQDTNHLPESSFYLGLADILTEQATKEIKNNFRRDSRLRTIEEIQTNLRLALDLFARDKAKYQDNQKQWFLQRKISVDQKLEKLREKHEKMLSKELTIV